MVDGHLEHAVNQVLPDGSTNMVALLIYNGKTYEVKGTALEEC